MEGNKLNSLKDLKIFSILKIIDTYLLNTYELNEDKINYNFS